MPYPAINDALAAFPLTAATGRDLIYALADVRARVAGLENGENGRATAFYQAIADTNLITTYFPASARQAGVKADGVTNDTPAINAFVTALAGKADVTLPAGSIILTAPVVQDFSDASGLPPSKAASFVGAGAATTLVSSSVNNDFAFKRIGGGYLTGGAQDHATFGGMTLDGGSQNPIYGRKGVLIERSLFSRVSDLRLFNYVVGLTVRDTVGQTFDRVGASYCIGGLLAEAGPNLNDPGNPGSPPNELVFSDTHWIANLNYALKFTQSGNLTFIGGSCEGLGTLALSGQVQDAQAASIIIEDGGFNSASVLNMFGFHFETNKGYADLLIRPGQHGGTYNINADFIQNGSTYVQHHIVLDLTNATAKVVLNLNGCGFRSVSGYVPSSARKCVLIINPNGVAYELNDFGCMFYNAIERPACTNTDIATVSVSMAPATGSFGAGATGTVGSRRDGGLIWAEVHVSIPNAASGVGPLFVTNLPAPVARRTIWYGLDAVGNQIRGELIAGTTNLQVTKVDGSNLIISGVQFDISGFYPAT